MIPDRPVHTLIDALTRAVESGPSAGPLVFLQDEQEDRLSYRDVLDSSRAQAALLRRLGVERGEPVLLLVPTSDNFVNAFFGLQLVGAVPCALAPPAAYGAAIDFAERTARIATYLGARKVVTTADYRDALAGVLRDVEILVVEEMRGAPRDGALEPVMARPDDLALLQCTSGSTGTPKGVMLTHANLLANVHAIGVAVEVGQDDVPVCWLPLYHDMGLIGCLLFSIYWRLKGVFLSPFRFLRRPSAWLRAISEHRGTMSPAPNFAYRYLTTRARETDLAGLDLSCWRVALCGSEPVDLGTLVAFEERFRACRLPRHAPAPCYGLAESSLAVTLHPSRTPLSCDRVEREPLVERGEVVDAAPGHADTLDVVDCGFPLDGTRVRVVDDGGRAMPDGRVGRVQVSGPSVMKGYWRLPEETSSVLRDGWLDTGDLGYLRGGRLRLAGREKDIVIIRGRKFPPTAFEWAAAEVPGVRVGNVVAFGLFDEAQGTEGVAIVCESEGADASTLSKAVRERVAERTGILPVVVEVVPRNTVPKTSSGKVQRARMREIYMSSRRRP